VNVQINGRSLHLKQKDKYEQFSQELKDEIEKNRDIMELSLDMKPSKARSAYQLYLKDIAQKESMKFGDMSKYAEKWKNMSDSDKEEYLVEAKKQSLIYIVKKRNYDAMMRNELGKAPSAYNLYLSDHAGEFKNLSESFKMWKKADTATKNKYTKLAEEAKKEFQSKVREFKSRVYEKPKRHLSAFNFYFKDTYDSTKEKMDTNVLSEIIKKIGEKWKKLSDKDKEKYIDMSSADKELKKAQLKEYEENNYYTREKVKDLKSKKSLKKAESIKDSEKTKSSNQKSKSKKKSKMSKK